MKKKLNVIPKYDKMTKEEAEYYENTEIMKGIQLLFSRAHNLPEFNWDKYKNTLETLVDLEFGGRKLKKERVRGPRKKIRQFQNIKTGEVFSGTYYQAEGSLGLCYSTLVRLCLKPGKTTKCGWKCLC